MRKVAAVDRQRLLESHHDIAALSDAGELTQDTSFQRALVRSRERLSDARSALREAVQDNFKETSETSSARLEVDEIMGRALSQYAFVRGEVQHGLSRVDPDAPQDALDQQKGQALFAAVFGESAGDLDSLGPKLLSEHLDESAQEMSKAPRLASMGLHGRLERAVVELKAKVSLWDREGTEDRVATTRLREARVHFDNEHNGHADQIRSVLRREASKHAVGFFVLSEDPAYKARRRTDQSLDDEPGITVIDEETVAPDSVVISDDPAPS